MPVTAWANLSRDSALLRRRRSLSRASSSPGRRCGGGDLFGLVAEHVHPLGDGAGILAQTVEFAAHPAQLGHFLGHLVAQGHQPGVAVEQVDVGAGFEQGEVFALAVDVHQIGGHIGQDLQTDRPAIDAADIAPGQPHLPVQRHPVRVVGIIQPLALQKATHIPSVGSAVAIPFPIGLPIGLTIVHCPLCIVHWQLKGRLHRRHLRPRPHPFGGRPIPQEQAHGVNDNGLPRAGFAGEDVQPGPKAQLQVVYDGKVSDVQFG